MACDGYSRIAFVISDRLPTGAIYGDFAPRLLNALRNGLSSIISVGSHSLTATRRARQEKPDATHDEKAQFFH